MGENQLEGFVKRLTNLEQKDFRQNVREVTKVIEKMLASKWGITNTLAEVVKELRG